MQSSTAFRTSGLTKVYGSGHSAVHALRGVDLEIPSGDIVVLLGPSGSGKSTLLNIIGGLDRGTKGEVYFRDHCLSDMSDAQLTRYRRDHVGFVFQFYNLMPSLTARENVEFGLKMRGVEKEERKKRALKWLDKMGILEFENRDVSTLSGGQKQRVALARSLVMEPQILLLDEPYEGLAPVIVDEIEKTLRIIKDQGITTILVEQNAVRALELADRAVILDTGGIVFDGTAQEVLDDAELRAEYLAI